MLLSIVMMVKNESKYLDKCLSSLEKLRSAISSELIIVDTGSEDDTVDIAKKYTNKVYYHPWKDDFGAMRNITIGYAKGQWLLVLDGDEVLEDSWPIIDFFNSNAYKKCNVAMVKVKSYSYTDDSRGSISSICRLFKNYNGFCYRGIIHEQPKIKPPVCTIDAVLLHYGYVSDDEELMERKFVRNTQLLKLALEKDPEDIYTLFQLSQSYGMRKDYLTALELAYKTYKMAKEKQLNLSKYMYVYTQLAQGYYYTEDYNKLEEICEEGLTIKEGLVDLYCLLGYAKEKLLKNQEAIKNYEIYLRLLEKGNEGTLSDITFSVYSLDSKDNVIANMCRIFNTEKRYDKVIEYSLKIKEENHLRSTIPYLVKAHLQTDSIQELLNYYNTYILVDYVKLKDDFITNLEVLLKDYSIEKKRVIYDVFSENEDSYSLLNLVRISLLNDTELAVKYVEQVYSLDFNNLPDYYGDCIFYLIKKQLPIFDNLVNLQEYKIENYFRYLLFSHNKSYAYEAIEYLKKVYPQFNLLKCKITKNIAKFILLFKELKNDEYNLIFIRYINDSITLIKQIYNQEIINDELISMVKNEEDAFIIYMLKALEGREIDELKYVGYLRKALGIYPVMQKGVKHLLNEMENKTAENSEFKEYKSKVKDSIRSLISDGKTNDASSTLKEYQSIVKEDIDIYAIESSIAIINEDLSAAEMYLKKGLARAPRDFDLLCNAAYLCQIQDNLDEAINLYKYAADVSKDPNVKEQLHEIITQLSESHNLTKLKEELSSSSISSDDSPTDSNRKTSIILLTYNNLEYNKLCINSIRNYTKPESYQLIVVDNASTDGTLEWLKEQRDIELISNSVNEGFPKGCNQGIKMADVGNDILLLNNDTIVMPNWLENLQTALYSKDSIGAVGAITNSCSNYQAISLPYDNFDDILAFATAHNHSNAALWEERLRLVGFCMLIRGDVIQKIGLLDERFTPGNFEDDDYSLRIRQEGYRLLLCKDTFIYHFGSMSFSKESNKFNDVLIKNRGKFQEKWGFDPYSIITINKAITQYLKSQQISFNNILELECAGGGTLLDIKNEFPNVDLFGIEKNPKLLLNYQHYADIKVGGFKSIETFERNFFDVIINASTSCKSNKLIENLNYLFKYVKPNGMVILKLTDKVKDMTMEELDKHRISFDSVEELQGDTLLAFYRKDTDTPMASKENSISIKRINQRELLSMERNNLLDELNDTQLGYILRRIENSFNSEEDLESLWNYLNRQSSEGKDKIIRWVDMKATNKDLILNLVASLYYSNNKIQEALSILEYAYTMNPQYADTVYNISLIVYELGDKETALQFLNNAEPLEGELLSLKQEIMEA
ncbi:glycosyltransferase [Alkaliphilus serpentinus]|uniref:Glycosyltransferase n=1 Tax=Alkaliphilus serpentinus TaxID=1482731 RepID=A0A833HLS5_9FIRM|nr:glycosyltransferase [Alkaliphilus serpentinus]KAB3526641.1 glycosyltransferase [Alkaliphilus serpentinus]